MLHYTKRILHSGIELKRLISFHSIIQVALGAFSVLQPSMVSKASGVSILATFRKSHRIIRRRSSTFPPKHCLPIQAVKYPPNRDEFTKGSLVDLVQPVQSNSELELRKPDSEDTTFIGSILQVLSRAKRRLIL